MLGTVILGIEVGWLFTFVPREEGRMSEIILLRRYVDDQHKMRHYREDFSFYREDMMILIHSIEHKSETLRHRESVRVQPEMSRVRKRRGRKRITLNPLYLKKARRYDTKQRSMHTIKWEIIHTR